jgi:hypothetical protein
MSILRALRKRVARPVVGIIYAMHDSPFSEILMQKVSAHYRRMQDNPLKGRANIKQIGAIKK